MLCKQLKLSAICVRIHGPSRGKGGRGIDVETDCQTLYAFFGCASATQTAAAAVIVISYQNKFHPPPPPPSS